MFNVEGRIEKSEASVNKEDLKLLRGLKIGDISDAFSGDRLWLGADSRWSTLERDEVVFLSVNVRMKLE